MRLIDADAFVANWEWLFTLMFPEDDGRILIDFYRCIDAVKKAPTVDAVEVAHGEWEFLGNDYAECTHCGRIFGVLSNPPLFKANNKFCPNCGAKMDGERREP
jgi:hypothetical protein